MYFGFVCFIDFGAVHFYKRKMDIILLECGKVNGFGGKFCFVESVFGIRNIHLPLKQC